MADGAPGLWKAARELWPTAEEQHCTVRALRNVTSKLPERHHRDAKARWWSIFDDAGSPAEARRGLEAIVADYRAAYPSAMAVIERDLDAVVAHLRWPTEHRERVRSTHLLERTSVEVRRRTKVIGRFPGETSALSLVRHVREARRNRARPGLDHRPELRIVTRAREPRPPPVDRLVEHRGWLTRRPTHAVGSDPGM